MDDQERQDKVGDQSAIIHAADIETVVSWEEVAGSEGYPQLSRVQPWERARVIECVGIADNLASVGLGGGGPREAHRLPLEDLSLLPREIIRSFRAVQASVQDAAANGQ